MAAGLTSTQTFPAMLGTRTRFDRMESHNWSGRLVSRTADFNAAGSEDLLAMAKLHERSERRLCHIRGVLGAQGLRKDITYADGFDHGTHRLATDQAGSRTGRLQQDPCAIILGKNLVGDCLVLQGNRSELGFGSLSRLADRISHLVPFSKTETDAPLPVTHHDQRAEAEPASTLHHLGRPVDENRLLDEAVVAITLGFLVATAGPTPAIATMISTPLGAVAAGGSSGWLLGWFYLCFFRHNRSSDGG